jgi:regulatory protein
MHQRFSRNGGEIKGRVGERQGEQRMAESRKSRARQVPRPLSASALENAALYYLGRFATSSGNLRRVLMRKVARAARAGGDSGPDTAAAGARMVEAIIARYLESGLLNDRAYAAQAAASLARRGTSRFSIAGKLRQKSVDAELVAEAITTLDEGGASELTAACALVRRRRLGPYRAPGKRAEWREKDLASLARAGFSLDLARRVLKVPDVETLERMARGDESG